MKAAFNSRRRKQAAVIVALALVVAPLTACSSNSGGSSATSNLTIGWPTDPVPLGYDPLRYNATQSSLLEGLYDSLFELKADGSIGPGLATSYKFNSTSTVLTLTLKKNVKFTDGSTLDAALVKANLDRRQDKALSGYASFATGGGAAIASVAVVGADEVAITFAAPQSGIISTLSTLSGMIVGKKGVDDPSSLETTPDGSGAYTLDTKDTVKASSYVLVKNTKGFDASAFPFQQVTIKPITDPQARTNALISGQIDTAQIDPATVALAQSKKVGVSQVGGTVESMITFDKLGKIVPAFGSEDVRQALDIAINRTSLVNGLHKGDLPAWNALPKASPGFDPALNHTYAYSISKAKSLLARGGYPNGFSFDVIVTPATQTDMEAVAKDFSAIGVTMNVKLASSTAEAFAAVSTTATGPIPIDWSNPVGQMYGIVFGFANMQGAKDPELSAATAQLAAAKTPAATATALKALNDRLVSSGWIMPLYELITSQGYNASKLKPVKFSGTNQFPLLSAFQPK